MMPHSNRLPLCLGLLVLAIVGSSAQGDPSQPEQITPSPTNTSDLAETSAADNSVESSAGPVVDASTATTSDTAVDKSAAESTVAILGTTFAVTPTMGQMETVATALLSMSETPALASSSAAVVDETPSSSLIMPASAAILSSSEVLPGAESILISSSEEFSPAQTSDSVIAGENSTLFVQSTVVSLESSQANMSELASSPTEAVVLVNSTVIEIQNSSSVQITPSISEIIDSANLSLSASLSSSPIPGTAEVFPTPSSTALAPPPSSSVPGGTSGGKTSPTKGGEGNEPEQEEEGGGGGGLSSGKKAAVGIFVTLAIIALIVLGIVLYRKNYFTPRSIKALMKGGIRYQTHDESMSYNDEGMLILPDRR